MKTVAIIEYGMGNLDSVARAVEECGGDPMVTAEPSELEAARSIILPGVGAFSEGMKNIRAGGFDVALGEHVLRRGVPFLGVCLGMQLMASKGWEGGETAGLGWIEGEVRRLEPDGPGVRIPHVGWNEVRPEGPCPLLGGVAPGKDFYFVHSYHFLAGAGSVLARTPYCGGFASVVGRGRMFGVQFHPEKGQKAGFQVLRNFLAL
jgi:imidazole glycerol-phosphate synthase subunit HisH